ncbi:matrixin family metalloprotease [Hymenobacter lutimineralis]|uniref:Matrixin family metalloprotease n=1 Tax=Hymenobacter lutimineralis TaxID=2606448 RepID=A0A5D6V2Q3_9BACT|nr:matrixin family metalloprotease [Hymenobacter lutimineralis]TYZ09282.1 matrixin family metalloprotease [Hymenobacter lutimineralis]
MISRFLLRLLALPLLTLGALPVAGQALRTPPKDPTATQCLLLPLDPVRRADRSGLIVEGEVLDARGFWDANHQRIYTAHRLRIYKVWKGAPGATVTVITEGGTVGLDRQDLTNTLRLTPHEQGVFFLTKANFTGVEQAGVWTPYGSQQGFIRYALSEGTAAEPFRKYGRITPAFYAAVEEAADGHVSREVQPNQPLTAALQVLSRRLARRQLALISDLGPLSITAGTGEILTINGTGFGSSRGTGYVAFRNADDGGATEVKPQDSDYVSWSDAQIRVRVPTYGLEGKTAGSGPVRVVTAAQEEATSAAPITVVYAVSTVQTNGTNEIVRPNHINTNNRGGYTFQPAANFTSRAGAPEAFQRSLTTWRCQTGVNWELGAERTGTVAADDNANGLGFDSGSQLPDRVLGRTTSYYQGCRRADGTVVFTVKEIDMVFDGEQRWQFGPDQPTAGQYDFESVVVHELGHAQQLSHLILPGAVMHYAIGARQVSRELNPASEIAGGRFVLKTRSFRALGCGARPMLPAPLVTVAPKTITAGQVSIEWTTTAECFVQEFIVERSQDTSSWTTLDRVPAGGASYRLLDEQAPEGRLYYRLGLVRPTGEIDYTGPQLVTDGSLALNKLELFPNPVRYGTPAQVQFLTDTDAILVLRLYDSVGREVGQQVAALQAGYNVVVLQLPAGLRSGWYMVRWNDQSGHRGAVPFVLAGQ